MAVSFALAVDADVGGVWAGPLSFFPWAGTAVAAAEEEEADVAFV